MRTFVLNLLLLTSAWAADEYAIKPGQFRVPVAPPLSPEEALKSFELVDGFRIELVAAEPLIEDPVAMSFDSAGRIYVAEMRGFTLDINGTGEHDQIGRVSILEDLDGDGRMDRSTVFLDKLVQPRSVTAWNGGALVADHERLLFAKDIDGDLRADKIEVIDPEYATKGSVEHRPNGLLVGIDNWIYNGASEKRYRRHSGKWEIGKIAQRGQWGITQDNYGRLFYNFNWSQLHADMVPPGYVNRHPDFRPTYAINVGLLPDQKVFPIRPNTAVNRGYTPGVLDKEGKLTTFASACSPLIYRGDNFPGEFQGNAFVCGPCANIIKRNVITQTGVALTATNAYPDREFLASRDERFRPVYQANGPDGALYVVDMYRGVVQQWNFMTKYLRDESNLRRLFSPVHKGRIYRIVHRSRPQPVFLAGKPPSELIKLLGHSNGWVRDTAQRLLIERDNRSVRPRLLDTALKAPDHLSRIHAIWTLRGLEFEQAEKLLPALDDRHTEVRIAAVRALEGVHDVRRSLHRKLLQLASTQNQPLQLQILLTLPQLNANRSVATMAEILRENAEWNVMREAALSGIQSREREFLDILLRPDYWPDPSMGGALMIESVAALAKNVPPPDPGEELNWRQRAVEGGRALRRAGHRTVATEDASTLTKDEQQMFAIGRQYFGNYCAPCHGIEGRGQRPLGPPLVDSEWVTGIPERLVRIVLHGMEGPVKIGNKTWQPPEILPAMPSMATIKSDNITAVLTYIRRAWGHRADPIPKKMVHNLRQLNFGRLKPWTMEELLEIQGGEDLNQGYRPIDEEKK